MAGHYNDNWEWVNDDEYTDSTPVAGSFTPPPRGPAVTWGSPNPPQNVPGGWSDEQTGGFIPANGGNAPGYMDLSYWASRGKPADQIFDFNTGQIKPGWTRTGKGYEFASQNNLPQQPPIDTTGVDRIPTTYGGYGGGAGGFGAGAWDPSGFQWPHFATPAPFSYAEFKAPSFQDIYNDPSYKGRVDEGLNAIEHSAAAKGLTRLPATQKALAGWNQDFASREYGNIFDRAANAWQMNRNNAAGNYATNYGIARDAFDMNEFQPSKLTFEDLYRRWRDELDANVRLATDNS